MKYCKNYRCGRVLPEGFDEDTCPYCGVKEYSWDKGYYFKDMPTEASDVKQECKKCGSTEELCYSELREYSTFSMGNDFECQTCVDEWNAEHERQEAMNYIIPNNWDDEPEFFDSKEDVEKHFEDIVEQTDYEGIESYASDLVVLKVEKMDEIPKAKDFKERNILFFDDEWYKVEEVIEPEFTVDGDYSIGW